MPALGQEILRFAVLRDPNTALQLESAIPVTGGGTSESYALVAPPPQGTDQQRADAARRDTRTRTRFHRFMSTRAYVAGLDTLRLPVGQFSDVLSRNPAPKSLDELRSILLRAIGAAGMRRRRRARGVALIDAVVTTRRIKEDQDRLHRSLLAAHVATPDSRDDVVTHLRGLRIVYLMKLIRDGDSRLNDPKAIQRILSLPVLIRVPPAPLVQPRPRPPARIAPVPSLSDLRQALRLLNNLREEDAEPFALLPPQMLAAGPRRTRELDRQIASLRRRRGAAEVIALRELQAARALIDDPKLLPSRVLSSEGRSRVPDSVQQWLAADNLDILVTPVDLMRDRVMRAHRDALLRR